MGMKAYPTYKDSGVQWLAEVPSSWNVFPAKQVFADSKERRRTDDTFLTASQKYGVISQQRYMQLIGGRIVQASQDFDKWKHVEPDDFVISLRSFQGGLEMCAERGCVTWHYVVLKPKMEIIPLYFKWLFKSFSYIKSLQSTCNFIRDGQDLRYSNFVQVPIPFPPLTEQKTIASFLDKKCAEIEELISRRQAIIDRLKELKQSIIADAVTKGLNPDVPMKDSGTAWQGKVPAHWKKNRNKNEIFPKVNHVGDNPNKLPMLSLTKKGVIVRDLESGKGKFSADESKFLIVEPGDFVFCHYDIQETPRTVGLSSHLGYITGSYNIYGFKGENSQFFYYLHECFDDRKLLCPLYKGLRNTIRQDRFLSMRIFLPPAEEQKTIVAYLDKKCGEIDELVARQEQIIEKLKELKTSTIAHVVTGKVDVRDAI